ncbi:MAG: hypothetical protein H7A51_05485 [Akkermansiaceae bacterium]|nr:hypothetical protein [Akkermansiaceae bacterium]
MNPYQVKYPRLRRIGQRASSLIVLLQKSPYVQFLLPEAKLISSVATADAVKMTIATVAGLGVFDSVSGATEVVQVSPSANSNTVPATTGEALTFVFQAINIGGEKVNHFSVTGTLPPGLSLAPGVVNKSFGSITGTPTQAGTYSNIQIRAWEKADEADSKVALGTFTIVVAAPPGAAISQHPASTTINSGETTTLNVTASGTPPFTYQWYQGASGSTTTPVGTNSSSFTTPALTTTTLYWVKVSNTANPGGANSNAATVTVINPFDTWRSSYFNTQQLADSDISGPTADPDKDGVSNEDEYIFGTSPVVSNPPLVASVNKNGGNMDISFTAVSATGAGYSGKTRHYAIEVSDDMSQVGAWPTLAGYSDMIATGQTVTAQVPINTDTEKFYRIRSWLTP